jgi:hypothetical protein
MGFPVLGALGIGAASSLLGGLFSSGSAQRQARKQRAENRYLAEYQYQKDLEMWNRQNEYNRPEAQMQRLKDAGLNPNLIYGSGGVTGNTSTQLPKYQRPEVPRASMQLEIPNALSMLNMYQDYQNKGVQHDNLKKQGELLEKSVALKDADKLLKLQQGNLSRAQQDLLENSISNKLKTIEYQAKNEKLRYNMNQKDWERYERTGIAPQDRAPWYIRPVEQLFNDYMKKNFGSKKYKR